MGKQRSAYSCFGTVLLAEVDGISRLGAQRGYEAAFCTLRDCLTILTDTAQRNRGSVDDGFGDWTLTTFDVTRPLTQAPRAALRAALAMRHQLSRYTRSHSLPIEVGLRVGVDSGPVIAGDVGAADAPEIAVMGEAVCGATALKDRAPRGSIYVDPDTYLATRDAFAFRELERAASGESIESDNITGWLPARELLGEASRSTENWTENSTENHPARPAGSTRTSPDPRVLLGPRSVVDRAGILLAFSVAPARRQVISSALSLWSSIGRLNLAAPARSMDCRVEFA